MRPTTPWGIAYWLGQLHRFGGLTGFQVAVFCGALRLTGFHVVLSVQFRAWLYQSGLRRT